MPLMRSADGITLVLYVYGVGNPDYKAWGVVASASCNCTRYTVISTTDQVNKIKYTQHIIALFIDTTLAKYKTHWQMFGITKAQFISGHIGHSYLRKQSHS